MRSVKITFVAILLLAACAGSAHADAVAAYSLFGGTVTQAPDGNVFGVQVGSPILGEIFYPPAPNFPPDPCFTVTGCQDPNFSITLTMGAGSYATTAATQGEFVSLVNGFVTGINVVYPPDPCAGVGSACPALTLSGNQLFSTDCAPGAVCGTLDFSDSRVTSTPEPSAIILMASGLLGLMLWAATRSKAAPSAQPQTNTISPRLA
jgi:hypothetical protein